MELGSGRISWGQWCAVNVLKAHAPTEDRSSDSRGSLCQEMRADVRQFCNCALKKAQGHQEGFRLNIKHINFWSALMALIYGTETYTKILLAAIKRGGIS